MMAKRVGQVNENTGKIEVRTMRRTKVVDFPVTRVDTRWKRLKRSLVN